MAQGCAAAQITLQRIAKIILVILVSVTVHIADTPRVHSAQLGTLWQAHLDVPAVTATMGDLTGDGVLELVVATTDRVYIFTWDDVIKSYVEHIHVGGFPAPIATLAVADTNGSGREDLVVGMEGSGSIQIYSLQGHALVSQGMVGRLWSSVKQLLPTDIDQDGKSDLLALSEDGTAVLFYNTGNAFQSVWQTPANEDPDRYIAVGNYIGDDVPTVIAAKEQGRVSIYRWKPNELSNNRSYGTLIKLYENYPWGSIGALDLISGPPGTSTVDLYVATSQNLLYQYGWRREESRHLAQWPQHVVGTVERLEGLAGPGVTRPTWLSLENGSLRAWELSSTGLEPAWELPENTLWFVQTSTGYVLFFSDDQTLRVAGPVPNDFLRVDRQGKGHVLRHPAVLEGERLFLSADDFSAILSLRGWTTRNGTRFSGVATLFQFFIIDADSDTASVNGRARPLEHAPRIIDDILYLPLSFAEALGFSYDWFAPLRHLSFD